MPISLVEEDEELMPNTSRSTSCVSEGSAAVVPPPELRRGISMPSRLEDFDIYGAEDCYLIPSLLPVVTNRPVPHPPKEYVHLEYRYAMPGFIPPGLMENIMAKMYFNSSLSETVAKQCSRNRFFQQYVTPNLGNIKVLIMLDRESACESKPTTILRIIGIGTALAAQLVLDHLRIFDNVVSQTLDNYYGICNSERLTICPLCVLAQRDFADCGTYNQYHIDALDSSLLRLTTHSDKTARNSWRRCKIPCSKHGCEVSPELLTCVPRELIEHLSLQQRSENMLEFFMEEVIRLQSVSSTVVTGAVCRVMYGIVSESEYNKAVAFCDGATLNVFIRSKCSGVATYISANQDVYILSCEHFVTDRSRYYPELPGVRPIFLIGGHYQWCSYLNVTCHRCGECVICC